MYFMNITKKKELRNSKNISIIKGFFLNLRISIIKAKYF